MSTFFIHQLKWSYEEIAYSNNIILYYIFGICSFSFAINKPYTTVMKTLSLNIILKMYVGKSMSLCSYYLFFYHEQKILQKK